MTTNKVRSNLLEEFDDCMKQAREKIAALNKPVKVSVKMFIGKDDRCPKIQCKIEELVISRNML